MKKRLLHILCFLCFLIPAYSWAQCDSEAFLDKCAILDDFKFVKANKIKLDPPLEGEKAPKAEYSHLLSNGNTYIITACHEGAGNMIVELYDRNRKFIASNYDKSQKKYYPSINYVCAATGVYYLIYSFVGAENTCGVGVIGVK